MAESVKLAREKVGQTSRRGSGSVCIQETGNCFECPAAIGHALRTARYRTMTAAEETTEMGEDTPTTPGRVATSLHPGPQRAVPRAFTFVGGATGAWQITTLSAVRGAGLPAARSVAVFAGAAPVPEPAEAGERSRNGELGSEGGSQGDLVQAQHASKNASSDVSSLRASSGVAVWVVLIIVVTVIIVWYVAHAL